jgi:hypothetical protein
MKKLAGLLLMVVIIQGCHKQKSDPETSCDVQKTMTENTGKLTIPLGIWGTVYFTEGNCMPMVVCNPDGTLLSTTTCKSCPVKRTVQIYAYTKTSQALPYPNYGPLFDSFSTQLIKEVETDNQGFYQVSLPAGIYTIAIKENGKLYANGGDGQGGITPVEVGGPTKYGPTNYNVNINYKASY